MLNLGSLVLGIGAWILAVFSLTAPTAPIAHKRSVYSFGFCVISLLFQIMEVRRRVSLGDYAAIADTIPAVLLASTVLATVTFILNLLSYTKSKKKFEVR